MRWDRIGVCLTVHLFLVDGMNLGDALALKNLGGSRKTPRFHQISSDFHGFFWFVSVFLARAL